MKPSQNTLDSLADMGQVATLGDVRRIIGQSLLALARKEISAGDVAAMSKGVDAIANSLHAEVALFKLKNDMREHGAELGKLVRIGATLIGNE